MKIKQTIVIILFCISSFFNRLEFRNNELENRWYPNTNLKETTVILEADGIKSDRETLNIFLDTARKHNVTFMVQRASEFEGHFSFYIYGPNVDLLDNIPLINANSIDFTTYESLEYYSSLESKESSGLIFAYFPNFFYDFRIMNLKPIDDKPNLIYGWISFVGEKEAINETIKDLQENFGESLIVTNDALPIDETVAIDAIPFMITLILMIIIMLQFLTEQFKEISIRKTLGESHQSIIYNIFAKDVLRLFFMSAATYGILYLLFVRTFNIYTFELIKDLVKYIFALVGLLIFSIIIMYLILTALPPTAFIKNKTFNEKMYAINFVMKVVLVIVLMPTVINTSESVKNELQWKSFLEKYYPLAQRSTSLISRSFESHLMREEYLEEIEEDFKSLENTYAYVEGSLTEALDFEQFYHIEEGYLEFLGLGYLDLSQNKPSLLIPKGYKKEELIEACSECDYVELKQDYQFYIFGVVQEMEYDNLVLISYPKRSMLEEKNSYIHYINIAESEANANKVAEYMNTQYGRFVTYGGQPMSFYILLLEVNTKIRNLGIKLIEILLILFFVLYNGVTSLYELSRKRMSLYYTFGRSKKYRMRELIIQDFFLIGLLTIYLFSKGFSIQTVLLSNCLVVIIDMLIALYTIHHNERRNLTQSLKE